MNILIAGGSGFLGQTLFSYFSAKGHQVKTLVRRAPYRNFEITWNPEKFEVPETAVLDSDVIINLCGRNISDSLWTAKFKQELFESRIKPTRTLASAINKARDKKLTFISTSGIGIYGSQLSTVATEDTPAGTSFFSGLAESWEKEALAAQSSNHRVAIIRLAVVVGSGGGLLKKMAPAFKLGLGAKVGTGKNWMSWIALEDVCRALEHIIESEKLQGPINLANPTSYLADNFYEEIGKAFGHSVIFRVPTFVFQPILGEFAEETILASQQVAPKKLLDSGFKFTVNSLRDAASKART